MLMKGKWIGLAAVLVIAGAIGYKAYVSPKFSGSASAAGFSRVLLVAELSEADATGDSCAEIIHLVRSARDRGIGVQELEPDSQAEAQRPGLQWV
jgi:hypothetical protein